jgi:signal transduction histidine kinase
MQKNRKPIQANAGIIIKKITGLLLLVLICSASACQVNIQAQKGIIDLRNWDWTKNGISDLNGEWEFYWKSLYSPTSFDSAKLSPTTYAKVPGFWNSVIPESGVFKPAFGYATYRLKVLCPPSNEKLELKLLTISSAYKLFINGKQIFNVGNVGTSKATEIPSFEPVVLPVTPENNELDIVIQVSNFTYDSGGIWDFIKLGSQEQIDNFRIRKVALDFFISGSFFLIGIFYFVIFFFFKRRLSPLYFSVFCMILAIRPLITDELAINYVTNWSWQFIRHVEFTSFYLAVPVLSLFSYELFPAEFSKKILRFILIISTPFILMAVFTSPIIFRYTLRPFQIFMLLTACYGLFVYIKAVKNKRPGSVYFMAGFILLFITIINDLLYTSLIIESVHLVYAGMFIFIISQAITLSKQFFWTFSRLEVVNKKLELINEELSSKNDAINEANDQLTRLNAELDSLVYRISHDLRSPVTSILTLVEIIKEEKNEAKRNEYLNMQKNTLLRLDSLITGTLDFTKNKRIELSYESVDFNEFINSALQDHIFSENSKDIKRIVEIDQQGIFITDKTRLNIVINNLISNALRYHNKEQDHPYLKIAVKATARQAELIVKDNGQGVDEEHLEHIYTMFYRANKTLDGSGIGLYIAKEAIEKLGGTIKIESQINVGTKFTIVIPNHKKD